jgi:DnaK suppressor protein
MAAKKAAPKSTKGRKPAVVKSAPKKAAAPKKPATKSVSSSAKRPVAAKPVVKPAVVKPVVVKPVVVKPVIAKVAPQPVVETTIRKPMPAIAPPASGNARAATRAVPRAGIEIGDEAEGSDGLLAGPRNVQPYVVKRGEQYMSKEQLEHFRTILSSWKRDLMMEVDRTVSHMKDEAANFPDPNDRATQEEEFSLELRTRDRERKLIRKIDEALGRIEDGSYGYCLETGEQIGVKRLEARPVATLSIEAQERRERREKQYGDRDDRYR